MAKYLLWVDDDRMLLSHAVSRLKENRIPVRVASTIDEAMAVVASDLANIRGVMVDLMMDPGVGLRNRDHDAGFETGFRFVDWLYENQYLEALPTIILTNKDDVGNAYSPRGQNAARAAAISIRVERKAKYKAIKFVRLVKERFPDG